jgi:hypothetical protein
MSKDYRVRIIIYDADFSHEEPETFTDDALYASPEEIAQQAYRTQRAFLQDLAEQS